MTTPNPILRLKRERRTALVLIVLVFLALWMTGRACPPLVMDTPSAEHTVQE